ncbi:hypothetical protein Pst134EB_010668 [Puccinia striiformis f. sp. tritici]|nr:hypothetical protein Pst134EB_010668 [Puccinia striiformis f. sp. tritici]
MVKISRLRVHSRSSIPSNPRSRDPRNCSLLGRLVAFSSSSYVLSGKVDRILSNIPKNARSQDWSLADLETFNSSTNRRNLAWNSCLQKPTWNLPSQLGLSLYILSANLCICYDCYHVDNR